jgi:hypothetical protein
MNCLKRFAALGVALANLAGCQSVPVNMPADQIAFLDRSASDPEAGLRIYTGHVALLGDIQGTELYHYERHASVGSAGLVSTHVTLDKANLPIVWARAIHDAGYQLTDFEILHRQRGFRASVHIEGSLANYRLDQGGRVTTASETLDAPLVTAPTVIGFILAHWADLAAGRTLDVRFAVPESLQSYAFVLTRVPTNTPGVTIRMTATDLFVGLVIAPNEFDFDASSRLLTEFRGRVPPLRFVDGKGKEFDGRVTYVPDTAVYR